MNWGSGQSQGNALEDEDEDEQERGRHPRTTSKTSRAPVNHVETSETGVAAAREVLVADALSRWHTLSFGWPDCGLYVVVAE